MHVFHWLHHLQIASTFRSCTMTPKETCFVGDFHQISSAYHVASFQGDTRKTPENTDLIPNHYPYCMLLATCTMTRPFLMPSLQGMFLTPIRSLSSKLSETHCHGAASAQEMLLQHIANHLKHRTTMTTHSLAFFLALHEWKDYNTRANRNCNSLIPSISSLQLCCFSHMLQTYNL